jgi:DMATS type aromatic prenyltransferase
MVRSSKLRNPTTSELVMLNALRMQAGMTYRNRSGLSERTHEEFGVEGLAALSYGLGIDPNTNPLLPAFAHMVKPWGSRQIGTRPVYKSDASNDYTPYEYSIALGSHGPEMRFIVEAQGEEATLKSNQIAARELSEKMGRDFGTPLARLNQVEDLFFPENPQGLFSAWHAVCWRPDTELDYKIYMNLHASGSENAPRVLREAMTRLGLEEAWRNTFTRPDRHGQDVPVYFSLDLSSRREARIKVYQRHFCASAADVEAVASLAKGYRRGDATALFQAMAPSHHGAFTAKPVMTCFSFIEGESVPTNVTLYFPISAYSAHDGISADRLRSYMGREGVPTEYFESAVRNYATRPMYDGNGMISYIGVRREQAGQRMNVYFGPEAYSTWTPRAI